MQKEIKILKTEKKHDYPVQLQKEIKKMKNKYKISLSRANTKRN